MEAWSHILWYQECRKVWRNKPHIPKWTPKWIPILGIGVLMDSKNFRRQLQRSKFIGLKIFLYHWKVFKTKMSKMGSYNPFEYLKHNLWPKDKSRIKLTIWLTTIKIEESSKFPYVQMTCHISLKFMMRTTIFLKFLIQLKVWKKIYEPLMSHESQFRKLWDS